MAGRGPIPKPAAKKIDKRSRVPAPKPKLEILAPVVAPPPDDLPADEAPLWGEIVAELDNRGGMASAFRCTDTMLVRCLVEAVSVHSEASADVRDRGILVDGRYGEAPNASLRVQRDSASTILRLCSELGLTPAGRTRLGLELIIGASLLSVIQERVASKVIGAVVKKRLPR
jgi:P27 family predicted phage terminase small subunit